MGIEPSALAEMRRRLGMTQGRMAAFLRVARHTVVRWESGAHRPRPYLAHALRALADEVGVDLEAEYGQDAGEATGPSPEEQLAELINAEVDPKVRAGLIHTLAHYLVARVYAEDGEDGEENWASPPSSAGRSDEQDT